MERKINSTFEYNNKTYVVKEGGYCDECNFHHSYCYDILPLRGMCSAWDRKDHKSIVFVELPKEEETMENVEISKENILKAAKENPCAEKVLKDLFPKVFEEENKPFCKIGSIFKYKPYPNNVYTLFKDESDHKIKILSITVGYIWPAILDVSFIKDPKKETLTLSEFRQLLNFENPSDFNFNVEVIEK